MREGFAVAFLRARYFKSVIRDVTSITVFAQNVMWSMQLCMLNIIILLLLFLHEISFLSGRMWVYKGGRYN